MLRKTKRYALETIKAAGTGETSPKSGAAPKKEGSRGKEEYDLRPKERTSILRFLQETKSVHFREEILLKWDISKRLKSRRESILYKIFACSRNEKKDEAMKTRHFERKAISPEARFLL